MEKIRIGILGYGNLGRGVELAIKMNDDMTLVGVFTRREGVFTDFGEPCISSDKLCDYTDKIDVLVLCGGSATDLPEQGKAMLAHFNTVDSFDTHAKIPEYFASLDEVGRKSGKLGVISVGWDPGLFSIARCMFGGMLGEGNTYTFWGKGVSQGHSDAIRRIKGVAGAIQYTVPSEGAIAKVRDCQNPNLSTREKHIRECYIVAEDGADKTAIENEIKTMPNYFADYDTVVHFITAEELKKNHSAMPHGGFVMRSGKTSDDTNQLLELSIKLDSNPQFTGSVLTAYARAVYRMAKEGRAGAVTVFDIPLGLLCKESAEELRKNIL